MVELVGVWETPCIHPMSMSMSMLRLRLLSVGARAVEATRGTAWPGRAEDEDEGGHRDDGGGER